MTYKPRSKEEVYESLRLSLTGKISKLRNFTNRSFNYVWTQAFADELQTLEAKSEVAELAGWVDYTGKELTEDDIDDLELGDNVTAEQLNQFMDESYLDEYVKIAGITRFEGTRATGKVTILTTDNEVQIPEGTIVTTNPSSVTSVKEFETTSVADSPKGTPEVEVQIQAVEPGSEYNVPADEIVRFDSPPIGVKGVYNNTDTTGGEDRESNEELRQRAKNAVTTSSLGGTTNGIIGYIQKNVEAVGQGDVVLDEFTDQKPPYVDVIVDGGIKSEILKAIETSRPTGIRHNLVRPQTIQIGWDITLDGEDIQLIDVKQEIKQYLLDTAIGDTFYQDGFIRMLLNSDDDILTIDNLNGYIQRVTGETFTYKSGKTDYRLDYTYDDTNGEITITDENGMEYDEGADKDFVVEDQTSDTWPETIVWTGTTPNDEQEFTVDYDVTVPGETSNENYYNSNLVRDETFNWNKKYTETFDYLNNVDKYTLERVPFENSITIKSPDLDGSTTYTQGTDFVLIDDSNNNFKETIEWTESGNNPQDNEQFVVEYTQKLYQTEYEIVETPNGVITDKSTESYDEGTEYELVDYDGDDVTDSIKWTQNTTTPDQQEEFYFTYFNSGNIVINIRKKISSGKINVSQL